MAGSQSERLAAAVADGAVVELVEVDSRNDLRDLAVALRDRPEVDTVVLGASPGGKGAAIVAAVTPGSGRVASELIAAATRTIGGGGGKGDELAVAGGRDPDQLPAALEQVRALLA